MPTYRLKRRTQYILSRCILLAEQCRDRDDPVSRRQDADTFCLTACFPKMTGCEPYAKGCPDDRHERSVSEQCTCRKVRCGRRFKAVCRRASGWMCVPQRKDGFLNLIYARMSRRLYLAMPRLLMLVGSTKGVAPVSIIPSAEQTKGTGDPIAFGPERKRLTCTIILMHL